MPDGSYFGGKAENIRIERASSAESEWEIPHRPERPRALLEVDRDGRHKLNMQARLRQLIIACYIHWAVKLSWVALRKIPRADFSPGGVDHDSPHPDVLCSDSNDAGFREPRCRLQGKGFKLRLLFSLHRLPSFGLAENWKSADSVLLLREGGSGRKERGTTPDAVWPKLPNQN